MDNLNQMQHIRFFCEDTSEILQCVKTKTFTKIFFWIGGYFEPKAANYFFVNTRFVDTYVGTDDNIYETRLFYFF